MVFYKTNLFYALIVLSVVIIMTLIYYLYFDKSTTVSKHHHNSANSTSSLPAPPNIKPGSANTQSVLLIAQSGAAASTAPAAPAAPAAPHIAAPHIASPHIAAPHIASPHIAAPHIASPHIASPHIAAPHIASPHINGGAPHINGVAAANSVHLPPVKSAPIIPVKKAPIVPLHVAPVITKADIINAVTKTKNAVTTLTNTLTAISYMTTINPSNVSKSGIPNHPIFVNAPHTYGTTPTKHLFARLGDYLNAAMNTSCPSSTTCSGTGLSALKTYKLMKQVHTETNKYVKQYLPVFSAVVGAGVTDVAGAGKIDTHKLWPIINDSKTFINEIEKLNELIIAFIIDIRWMTHVQYVPPWYSGFYDIIAGYITQLKSSITDIQAAVNEVGIVSSYN